MGAWGFGTFENDTALDFLDNLMDQLKNGVRQDLESAESDGMLERESLAAAACLRALAAAIPDARFHVTKEEAAAWRDAYLSWFDANADEFGAEPDDVKAMRQSAAEEFEALIGVAGEE